jgi:hypothetical protein
MPNVSPRRVAAALAVCAGIAASPSAARAADLHATPATLRSLVAAAQPGDVIHLASGDYGTFAGAMKPGWVTLTPEPGATPTMDVEFDPASYIALDGLQLGDIDIAGTQTKHIVVSNSNVTGQTILHTGELANADITFNHNVHANWSKCSGCNEARFWLPNKTSQPSGVTIENSQFGPGGVSDGIQNGSNGTRIIDNVFTGIKPDPSGNVHADALQLYGSSNTVIEGNYFYNDPDEIMIPDGADHEVIEDNVIVASPDAYPYAITLMSDNGSIVSHNTLQYGNCAFNLPCGLLRLGSKTSEPAGQGTVVRDNVLTGVVCCDPGSATFSTDHNLVRQRDSVRGAGDLLAAPLFAGGAQPGTFAGYLLAPGSPGKGTASDGTDRGIWVTPPAAAPAPAPPGTTATPVPAVLQPLALVAAYAFDERRGRRVADASGHRHAGRTVGRVSHVRGRFGRALAFASSRSAVVLPAAALPTGAVTIDLWLKPARRGTAWREALRRGGTALLARGARVRLRAHAWTHVALVYDGHSVTTYVNGRSAGRRTAKLPAAKRSLRLGFRGAVDNLRIYRGALTAVAVRTDMRRRIRA